MQPRAGETRYWLAGAFYRMAHVAWGDPAAPVVVCVHGLTRNGRDFDPLAQALAERFHVVCPDLPGRGGSDWLPDGALYEVPSYVQALSHLLAAIGRPVQWVGTSLGGICGMAIAAAAGQPVTRMVLNDIGPHIPQAALRRIRDYMVAADKFPAMAEFADLDALEQHLRLVHAPFGRLTDAQWAHLARHSARPLADGRLTLHYDPKIADPMRATEPADVDLWAYWDKIAIPVLVVRGQDSDLLLPETLARMQVGGAQAFIVRDAGHAPALMDASTISALRSFLQS